MRKGVKGMPFAVFTYTSVKYGMNRPFTLPHIHHIKNVFISSGIGVFTGICYPITLPLCCGVFLHLYIKSK
jgi:hypothetical protein